MTHFRHNFRHCEIFSKKISKFLGCPPPARIIITLRTNYYACGYFITRADIVLTECYVIRLCISFKKLIKMYKNGQKRDINCTFTYKDYMKLLFKESTKNTTQIKMVYKVKGRV